MLRNIVTMVVKILVEIMDPMVKNRIKDLTWTITAAVMVASCDFIKLLTKRDLIVPSILIGCQSS